MNFFGSTLSFSLNSHACNSSNILDFIMLYFYLIKDSDRFCPDIVRTSKLQKTCQNRELFEVQDSSSLRLQQYLQQTYISAQMCYIFYEPFINMNKFILSHWQIYSEEIKLPVLSVASPSLICPFMIIFCSVSRG